MIRVVAVQGTDRQTICETRWIDCARSTALTMSERHARIFLVIDDDGSTLGAAVGGALLDRFGEPIEAPPTLWN